MIERYFTVNLIVVGPTSLQASFDRWRAELAEPDQSAAPTITIEGGPADGMAEFRLAFPARVAGSAWAALEDAVNLARSPLLGRDTSQLQITVSRSGVAVRDVGFVIDLAPSAVEAYRDRVRPSLTFEEAEEEVRRRLPETRLELDAPDWLRESDIADGHAHDAYSPLSDGTVLGLEKRKVHLGTTHFRAITYIVRRQAKD